MRRQEAQSTRKTSLGSLDPIEKAVVAKFRANLSDLKAVVAELGANLSDLKAVVAELGANLSDLKAVVAELGANLSDHIADSTKHITWGIPLPYGAKLWHFDGSLVSTDGTAPESGAVATLRPDGRFGGAVAVEVGTTNLYRNPFFQNGADGWSSYNWDGGGKIYVEVMETPVGNSAMIMDNAGATGELALIQYVALPDAVSNYTVSLLVKNLSSQPCTVQLYMGTGYYTVGTVNPGDGWVRLTRTYVAGEYKQSENHYFKINTDRKIAIAAIQLEPKPFATSFVDGTRPDGILAYPITLKDDYTIACYRKSHTDEDYKHVVKRSDGKVFVDGVEDSGYDVGWIAGRNLVLNSNFKNGLEGWTTVGLVTVVSDSIYGSVCKVEATSSLQGIYRLTTIGQIPAGETITMRAIVRADAEMSVGIAIDGSGLAEGITKTIGTEWTEISITKVSTGVNTQVRVYANGPGTLYIARIKAERGSTATDWTPAPEDLGYSDDCLMFSNQTGLIDELLVAPFAATPEQIQAWYNMGVPFWDPWVGQR